MNGGATDMQGREVCGIILPGWTLPRENYPVYKTNSVDQKNVIK